MTTYSETGQVTQPAVWEDGSYDQPSRVLVSCDTCGATVPFGRVDLHSTTHTA